MKITDIFKRKNNVDCVHHFMLASPNGPTCEGKCKKCGLVKEYPNSNEGTIAWKRKAAKFAETNKKGSRKANESHKAKKKAS
tara:strand:+ start:2706 stop:2951 length:246 start_codon:yes stop_codon:yes gene_type:complete